MNIQEIKNSLFEGEAVVTPEQAIYKLKPGDKITVKMRKDVGRFGITALKKGKKYKAVVLKNGEIKVKHESVTFYGSTTEETKEEFVKGLKEQGDLCSQVIFCNQSTITRPGVGTVTFKEALAGEVPGKKEPKKPEEAKPEKNIGIDRPADKPMPPVDQKKNNEPTGKMDKKVSDVSVGETITPTMSVYKEPNGKFRIEYTGDSLGRKDFKADFDSEIKRLFGYSGWQEYKENNWQDLTRRVKPTVHPIHVAYGLEEFIDNFNLNDYSIVGVPKTAGFTQKLDEITGAGGEWEDKVLSAISGEGPDMRKDKIDTADIIDDPGGFVQNTILFHKNSMAIYKILNRRRGYYGDLSTQGILFSAMINPPEGLSNKKTIKDMRQQLMPKFEAKIRQLGELMLPVERPDGAYWTTRRVLSQSTMDHDAALKVRVSEALSSFSSLSESTKTESMDISYILMPKNWKSGHSFTRSESVFAKRVGANIDSGLSLNPGGEISINKKPVKTKFKNEKDNVKPTGNSGWWQALPSKQKKARVNPREVYEYLTSKGVSDTHAKGMLVNIYVESRFKPGIIQARTKAVGFFQYLGSRKKNLFNFYDKKGKDSSTFKSDWKTQVDFALTERTTKKYLSKDFESVEQAANWFTKFWERPVNPKGNKADEYANKYYQKAMKANLLGNIGVEAIAINRRSTGTKKVLVFGHSQAGKFGYGGAFAKAFKASGVEAERMAHVGAKDNELLDLLKSVPSIKEYSHVVLMVAGNTLKHLPGAQKSMIEYLLSNGINANNIYVSVPPINTARVKAGKISSEEEELRKQRNSGTESVARSLGVNFIQTIVSGDKSDWGKPLNYHLSHRSPKGQRAAQYVAGLILSPGRSGGVQIGSTKDAIVLPTKSSDPTHGYILGDLEAGGRIYAKYNENKIIANGASMNKPMLALVQLIKYKNDPVKKLTNKELRGLLAYTGHESNNVNRLITGRDPKTKKLRARKDTIGTISEKEAGQVLSKLGLDPNTKIRFGSIRANAQSPRQFFEFMRLLHDRDKIRSLGVEKEVDLVVNYMKRAMPGVNYGGDRESKKWKPMVEKLRSMGLPVTSIYGKGGRVKSGIHYAMVINNKYILVIYVNRKKAPGKKSRPWLVDKFAEILKVVMPTGQIKENKDLKNLLDLIEEVQDNELDKNKIQQKNSEEIRMASILAWSRS